MCRERDFDTWIESFQSATRSDAENNVLFDRLTELKEDTRSYGKPKPKPKHPSAYAAAGAAPVDGMRTHGVSISISNVDRICLRPCTYR